MTILVTGGAGFIGSNFILNWLTHLQEPIINLDKLTYASNLHNLDSLRNDKRYVFIQGDILNQALVAQILEQYQIRAIIHFAAESHVDRAIHHPGLFIQTNINGTFALLETSLQYWRKLSDDAQKKFRFHHISTDEVYGALDHNEPAFLETNRYEPNSPYSASKASADHLVRAFYRTYGFPVLITNCSNNYGPYQHPEKLIPLCIRQALAEKPIPIYGNGLQIRDWLYVTDHCDAIHGVLRQGKVGEKYNIGGLNEQTNLNMVKATCLLLDHKMPRKNNSSYVDLITHIQDRPGHDFRYAVDISKLRSEIEWQPRETFATGLEKTVGWYCNNINWLDQMVDKHSVQQHTLVQ